MYAVTGSEYCSETVDTVCYKWNYDQFIALERYVHFCQDRSVWQERQQEENNRRNKPQGQ